MVLDMAFMSGAGMAWAGRYSPAQPLTTLYIAGEGAVGIETLRRPAWKAKYEVAELPFYTISDMPAMDGSGEVDQLIRDVELAGVEPDIIIIDTVARAMTGLEENSAKDTGIFVAACEKLKRHFGATVIAIHHKGKTGSSTPRGSSNLMASFDAHFLIERQGASYGVTITNEKQKDGEPWSAPLHFVGEQTTFVVKGEERSSLVFRPTSSPLAGANLSEGARVDEVRNALESLDAGHVAVSTKGLATAIVDARLKEDSVLAAKFDDSGRDALIKNEMRTLQRDAKIRRGRRSGFLRQFVVSNEDDRHLLWGLPGADCDDSRQVATV